jgi:lipopolysaccharide/colanic/teichoic acid biosynthesis glycosyltransferase
MSTSEVNQLRYELLLTDKYSTPILKDAKTYNRNDFRRLTTMVDQEDGEFTIKQSSANQANLLSLTSATNRVIELNLPQTTLLSQSVDSGMMLNDFSVNTMAIFMAVLLIFGTLIGYVFYTRHYSENTDERLLKEAKVKIKPMTTTYLITKRFFDIMVSLVGFFGFLLFYIILWIFFQFGENKGPVLFKQARYGQHGKIIMIYKFRSMRVGAEQILRAKPELWRKYVDSGYKLEADEDPRITKLGAFIRKTSLDEIPQFLNVLQGELSLIGPRPIIGPELREYGDRLPYFLLMRPGITGVWGISGRSNLDYPERCDVELSYLEKRSLSFDLHVIVTTAVQVLRKEGAK